ncbi:MAG: carbohydrate ABC transporter permease, partial [Rhodospirillaceae bacterium]|nr:carbohydrate ABC transporter permease [Rhodospirillaceae bacterium]
MKPAQRLALLAALVFALLPLLWLLSTSFKPLFEF